MTRPILFVVFSSVLWASGITPSAYSLITTTLAPTGVARRQTLNFALSPGVVCADNAGTKATDCEFQFVDLVSDQTAAGIKTWTSRGNYGAVGSFNKSLSLYPSFDGIASKALTIGWVADPADGHQAVILKGGGNDGSTPPTLKMTPYDNETVVSLQLSGGTYNNSQQGMILRGLDTSGAFGGAVALFGAFTGTECPGFPTYSQGQCGSSGGPSMSMWKYSPDVQPYIIMSYTGSNSGRITITETSASVGDGNAIMVRIDDDGIGMYDPGIPGGLGGGTLQQGLTTYVTLSPTCIVRITKGILTQSSTGTCAGLNALSVGGSGNLTVAGAIPYTSATSGVVTSAPTQFFWDSSNNRLGIGNAVPAVSLDVTGSAAVSGTFSLPSGAVLSAASATRTAPVRTATTAPVTCTVGDLFFDSDATAGQNLNGCTATNTFTQLGGGGGGTPAGSTGQVQFNNAGAFGADANLFWDDTNNRLGVGTNAPVGAFDVLLNADTVGYQVKNLLNIVGTSTAVAPSAIIAAVATAASGTQSTALEIYSDLAGSGTASKSEALFARGYVQGSLSISSRVTGATLQAQSSSSGTTPALTAVDAQVYNDGGGTATAMTAVSAYIDNQSTATNAYGFRALSPSASGVTNLYGLKVDNQTGATNNWAIQTGTGRVDLGDKTNAPAFVSSGSTFSISGCSATSATGGATAGRFTSGTTGTCTVTVTMGSSMSSTNGWSCSISNQTTANLTRQTASTSTTATFSGVAVTGDVYAFACVGN